MGKENYDTYPYFYATPHCNCGEILRQHKTEWDLQLQKEPELKVNVKGRCNRCKQTYDFVLKIYTGANDEKYLGQFDATEKVTTISGVLTKNSAWDREKIIQYHKSVGQLKKGVIPKNDPKIINRKS